MSVHTYSVTLLIKSNKITHFLIKPHKLISRINEISTSIRYLPTLDIAFRQISIFLEDSVAIVYGPTLQSLMNIHVRLLFFTNLALPIRQIKDYMFIRT